MTGWGACGGLVNLSLGFPLLSGEFIFPLCKDESC